MLRRLICYLLGHLLWTPFDTVCARCGRVVVPSRIDPEEDVDTIVDCPHPHQRDEKE